MRRRGIAALALVAAGLAGCAGRPVATFTAADVTTAKQVAAAVGDTAGAQCWGALLPVAQAVENGQQIGAATAAELYRAAMLQAQGPCAPIVMPVLLKLGPLLGAAGGILAAPTILPFVP